MKKLTTVSAAVAAQHPPVVSTSSGCASVVGSSELEEVQYDDCMVQFTDGKVKLYWFYTKKNNVWVWDEDKLTHEEALKKYPKHKYRWVRLQD